MKTQIACEIRLAAASVFGHRIKNPVSRVIRTILLFPLCFAPAETYQMALT
jgi:hypothetical protein